MLKRPIIEKEYIDHFQEIGYFGETQDLEMNHISQVEESIKTNRGHRFQLLVSSELNSNLGAKEYEVVGWIERTEEIPFDFIIYDRKQSKHYLARLHGRKDGWPLFSVQPEGYTCARSQMGSDWNCLMCIKYFGTVCKAR
ncbi:hypothetical protein [Desulfitobacterium metallireducens]|uniref:Uncharacterized protein n=1 Tax=Desulfitobacterium metallireducens DSM 15288 TaxID=871968 RepID=W0EG39_9FIRM|nr:hypothetical protein [Desulfitobacterium metallireducens]AHF08488.1 hypothetical protein DESME_04910 [Desulfitobacterium metallireducens DSM 15288]